MDLPLSYAQFPAHGQHLYYRAGLACSKHLAVLGRPMAKLRYTRNQMEEIILRQLENLEALGDQARLLRKQNELLEKTIDKLQEKINGKKKFKFYPKLSELKAENRKAKNNTSSFTAASYQ